MASYIGQLHKPGELEFYKIIGEKVRKFRIKRELSLREFAALLGISEYRARGLENGNKSYHQTLFFYTKVCSVLRIRLKSIVKLDIDRPRPRPTEWQKRAAQAFKEGRIENVAENTPIAILYEKEIREWRSQKVTYAEICRRIGVEQSTASSICLFYNSLTRR